MKDLATIIGLQRAEFERAAVLQTRIMRIQIAIAGASVLSVVISDPTLTYIGTGVALALSVAWAWTNWSLRECRSQAERARRATMVADAFREELSENEIRDLQARFSVNIEDGKNRRNKDWFDTDQNPGFARLAAIIEESAFWSAHLLRHSAKAALTAFLIYFLVGAGLLFMLLPFLDLQQIQLGARILCVIITLLISAEVLGVALAYLTASRVIEGILPRLEALSAVGFPRADLLLVFSDYNSAVESAPLFRSGVYNKHRERLAALWSGKRKRVG